LPGIPIDELKGLPEFRLLPEGHQKFLEAYIANGYDVKAAALASYPNLKTAESVRVKGSRILHSPGVVMVLYQHYGNSPEDAFCQMVAQMILRGRITKEQESLIRLLAQVRGFVDPWSPRLEKKIEAGKSDSPGAVKKRAQRAARREETPADSQPAGSLLRDFSQL